MTYRLNVFHVDTCLPCFVQDHCNGETEALFGVPVDAASRNYMVRDELKKEIRNCGEKLPEAITESQVNAAVNDLFSRVNMLRPFDSSLEPFTDEHAESCYAWFRLTWTEES